VAGAGFPRVLLEAMAVGTPLVAYDTAGVRDVVPCESPAVPFGDAVEFRRRIEALLDTPAARERAVRAGRSRVREFSTDKVAERLIAGLIPSAAEGHCG
jgi:glycosyltransferase involved in cell wall biosynthesis